MKEGENYQPYEEKFRTFIELCQKAKETGVNVVIVNHPEVLGDDYQELVESLNRLATAGLRLVIAAPSEKRSQNT